MKKLINKSFQKNVQNKWMFADIDRSYCLIKKNYASGCFVCMSVCTTCVSGALDSLELELVIVVSYHVGSGNWTWVLRKCNQWFQLLSHLLKTNKQKPNSPQCSVLICSFLKSVKERVCSGWSRMKRKIFKRQECGSCYLPDLNWLVIWSGC